MKVNKISICCLLVIAAMLPLYGCNKSTAYEYGPANKTSASGGINNPVTINWLSFRGDDEQINDKLIKKFEYENPGIKVSIETLNDEAKYYQELNTRIASGGELELFQTHTSSYMVKLGKEGILEDLTDCPFTKNVFENILPITTIDGKVEAMLQSINLILIYYNKSIFEKYKLAIPGSFDELKVIIQKLKANGEGSIVYPGKIVESKWVFNMVMFPQITPVGYIGMYDELCSGDRTTIKDIPEMVNTCHILADINKYGLFYEGSGDIDIDKASELFSEGKASMMIMGTWKIGTAGKEFPDIDFGVFPFPLSDNINAAYGEAGQATAIYSKTKKMATAKRFMEFLFSPEVESIYCTETKQTPTIKGVKASYDMQYLVSDVMEKGFYILQPVGNDQFDDIYQILRRHTNSILFDGSNADDEINALEFNLKNRLKNK